MKKSILDNINYLDVIDIFYQKNGGGLMMITVKIEPHYIYYSLSGNAKQRRVFFRKIQRRLMPRLYIKE